MEEKFVKADELLQKADFIAELKKAENDTEVQKLFSKHGVDLELDDIAHMVEDSVVASKQGELSEDDLDSVSGGVVGTLCLAVGSIAFYAAYGYKRYIKR